MLIQNRCTVCHEDVSRSEATRCDVCNRSIHEPCQPYETQFDCPDCADDLAIGAVEF